MTNQNKAHAVNVGSVLNQPTRESGLMIVANDGAIIDYFSQYENHAIHAVGVARIGYNGGSKNLCSAPPLKKAVLFYPQIQSVRPKWACRFAVFGGVWYRQRPRCHRQLEHPHLFLKVAINLKTCGGHHA